MALRWRKLAFVLLAGAAGALELVSHRGESKLPRATVEIVVVTLRAGTMRMAPPHAVATSLYYVHVITHYS